jgi:hypothetical protein
MISPPTEPGFYWAIQSDRYGASREVVRIDAAAWGRPRLVVYVPGVDDPAELTQFTWLWGPLSPPAPDPA